MHLNIHMVGLNHKAAPVEIREQFAFPKEEIREALVRLIGREHVKEAALLSTCNRTECFFWARQDKGAEEARIWLTEERALPEKATEYLLHIPPPESIRHLFRVTSGLESMVLGESQVFTQVREAYAAAKAAGTSKRFLNRCLESAISAARRVRTETALSQLDVSVPAVVSHLAKERLGKLRKKALLVLGASEMAELTVSLLRKAGVQKVLVANRSLERAKRLAERFQASAYGLEELEKALTMADVVVCCTAASNPILTHEMVCRCLEQRKGSSLFLVDIAVPRDVEESVGQLEGVDLYDIDDLEGIASANIQENEQVLRECDQILQEEVKRFMVWSHGLQVGPLIKQIKLRAERIHREELRRFLEKQSDLTESQKLAFEKASHRMLGRFLHDPIVQMKEMAMDGDGEQKLEALRELLGME